MNDAKLFIDKGISEIEVHDPELKAITGNIKFYSILYRCFKIKSLETLCEDYGQVALLLQRHHPRESR